MWLVVFVVFFLEWLLMILCFCLKVWIILRIVFVEEIEKFVDYFSVKCIDDNVSVLWVEGFEKFWMIEGIWFFLWWLIDC